LENGFTMNNGAFAQGGREFGRQAFAGLSSNTYGTVTLGRQYDTTVDLVAPLSLTGTGAGGTYFAHPFDNDNMDNSFRVDNSVKYTTPNYGGFKFGGLYGFSNGTGTTGGFANNRAYSLAANYNYGGLTFAAGYMQLNNTFTGATAATMTNPGGAVGLAGAAGTGTAGTTTDNPFIAGRQRTYDAAVNYAFGPAIVGFVFSQTQLSQLNGIQAETNVALHNSSGRFTNYEVNGRYNLTPAWSLAAAYTFTQSRIAGVSPKWNQVSLLTDYALSKRTDVYLLGIYQHVSSVGNSGITADINTLGSSSTTSQVAATVGMRVRF
jgi:GBP family porin